MGVLVKPKAIPSTQTGRVLALLKQAGAKGVYNYELTRISLQYTGRIYALRNDGHNITAERQYLKNGRAGGTWKYYLND